MPLFEPQYVLKICGITCVEDAREAIDAGANALGFNFYRKSPRYLTTEIAQAIVSKTTGTYLRVGVFVNPAFEELAAIAKAVPLDVVQIHGQTPEIPENLPFRLWKALAGEAATGHEDGRFEAFLLDTVTTEYGGSGRTFRWELARGFKQRTIVAGGLDASNVAAAIATLQPWGVDACSRLELRPGKKDIPQMRAFLRTAHAALLEQNMVKL